MSLISFNIVKRYLQTTAYQLAKAKCHRDPEPVGHKTGGYKIYKGLTFFVMFPLIAAAAAYTYLNKTKCPEERPEFVPYSYLRIRSKRFPWGDGNHSLFHNCEINALPDGYEECEKEDGNE
ncbi:cytochrome c oxidase subunit 6A, mitochondrial-like [Aethina tumida]|uniref:cytochrome c oxidase subunit 6A, mitochondrial-like n=1 Tax=Aethina tumida TaxID=116153 RepID=UPI0021489A27|nr:cytochrome c oxidase subunit 6A, mitochondrial-like [Aethina tumida]